jgi:hypothetical protein
VVVDSDCVGSLDLEVESSGRRLPVLSPVERRGTIVEVEVASAEVIVLLLLYLLIDNFS